MRAGLILAALGVAAAVATVALPHSPKAEELSFTITIRDHKFDPLYLRVPAGQPFTLHIINGDKAPEEFECTSPWIEELMISLGNATVKVPALDAGEYPCFGEFHSDTAKGKIIAQ